MSEFLGNYGFFILIVLLMIGCHFGHGRHGGGGRPRDDEPGQSGSSPGGGHRH
jgi:hypothetical protein